MRKHDVVLAGVGGQGVVSLAVLLATGARREGLEIALSEVHGMAQRGGSVEVTLRLAEQPIHGSLVARGAADLVLATEPLEALRQLPFLSPEGLVLSSSDPVENIADYPDVEGILARLERLPRALLIPAGEIASRAGTRRAANTVMAGAASVPLGLATRTLEEVIRETFAPKGDKVVAANLAAFEGGRELALEWVLHPVA